VCVCVCEREKHAHIIMYIYICNTYVPMQDFFVDGKLIDDLEDHDLDVFSFNIKTFAADNKLTPIMCTSFRCGSKSAFTGNTTSAHCGCVDVSGRVFVGWCSMYVGWCFMYVGECSMYVGGCPYTQ
jgi:hypothetical protein